MGHFLELTKGVGLAPFDIRAPTDIFYAGFECIRVTRRIKGIPLQLEQRSYCLIALHVATRKG